MSFVEYAGDKLMGIVVSSISDLPETELLRKIYRYQRIDRQMAEKYQMSFAEFRESDLIEQSGYAFEMESDFWDWEMAQDGIEMIQTILSKL
jgi:hypothetical protein